MDFAKNLGLQNIRDLCKLIQVRPTTRPHSDIVLTLFVEWNEDNKYDLTFCEHSSPRLTRTILQDSFYAPIFRHVPFCLSREIRLFPRLCSCRVEGQGAIFHWASHSDPSVKTAGELANGYGHRLTLHPGQFTQLGSPKENVVEASVRELQCMWYLSIVRLSLSRTDPGRPLFDVAAYGNG